MTRTIKALALISNGISAEMLRQALKIDGYALENVAIVKQRPIDIPWAADCAMVVEFDNVPSLRKVDQLRLIPYYMRASRLVRQLLRSGELRDVYMSNIDNLVSNHVLLQAARSGVDGRSPRLSVVAEGFMNYQDITKKDRAGWRWAAKPAAAALLRLSYRHPTGHLSGSDEPAIERVFAYSPIGLKSPPQKFVAAEFPRVEPARTPDPKAALLILTGIGQWMKPEQFAKFRAAFVTWINAHGFEKIYVKRHPFYPSGGLENDIRNAVIIDDPRRLEEMAAELPAQNVIGYCTTALVILKLMRPDLTFTDWGSDFYCNVAYSGDRSIVNVLSAVGVRIVEMAEDVGSVRPAEAVA